MADNDYKSQFKTGAEVLQKLLEGKVGPVSDQYLRWKLWLNWKEIVGPTVSTHSEPISYRNGLLWLWVENSVWMQQMGFMSETIIETINKKFRKGFVREIRYTLDRRQVPSAEDDVFRDNVKKFLK
ncbi:MAG: DUF721 domain-containing protein [Pseudobdellovibrio sp.]